MTGVIVRSAANVDAGAKTRRSAILHGIWLLLFVTFLDDVLARVPVSALAGVLVFTGWKLLELPAVWKLWNDKVSRQEAVFYLVTAAGIVLTDLLTGVLIGLGVSAARLLWMLGNLEIKRVDDPDGKAFQLHLLGAATFLRLPDLAAELERVPPGRNLHVHVEQVTFVDHAVLNLLHTFETRYESAGGQFTVDWERVDASFRSTKPTPTSATQYGEFALPPAPVGR